MFFLGDKMQVTIQRLRLRQKPLTVWELWDDKVLWACADSR